MLLSNLLSAEEVATRMGLAVDAVQQAKGMPVTKAENTSLTVNAQAQDAHNELITIAEQLSTCFNQAMDNIQSTAKEFERIDSELGEDIRNGLQTSFGLSE
ncbi:MAG TPA: TIGR04197 family type VII secretion effector [Bacillota bacterium]|nr:TIGR04197 family type VII secretion effector [Bacillota bacterium]